MGNSLQAILKAVGETSPTAKAVLAVGGLLVTAGVTYVGINGFPDVSSLPVIGELF